MNSSEKMQNINLNMVIGIVMIAIMSAVAFLTTPSELILKQETINYIAICSAILAMSAYWTDTKGLMYKWLIKSALYFLFFGISFLFLFALSTTIISFSEKQQVSYSTKIFNAVERKGAKSGTNCKFLAYFKNKEKNDWLYTCLSQDEFNQFKKDKVLNVDVKLNENLLGFMIENVELSKK